MNKFIQATRRWTLHALGMHPNPYCAVHNCKWARDEANHQIYEEIAEQELRKQRERKNW